MFNTPTSEPHMALILYPPLTLSPAQLLSLSLDSLISCTKAFSRIGLGDYCLFVYRHLWNTHGISSFVLHHQHQDLLFRIFGNTFLTVVDCCLNPLVAVCV